MITKSEIRWIIRQFFQGLILFFCLIFAVGAAHADNPPALNPIGDKSITANLLSGFTITCVNPNGIKYDFYLSIDVTLDGVVSPLDVLTIINALNNRIGLTPDDPDWRPELDVTGDGVLSPLDVLTVINALNNGLTQKPAGASIDRDSGNFSWQPNPGQVGDHRLMFVASRGDLRDLERITITVNMPAPDSTAPIGTVTINDGAEHVSSRWVTLGLVAEDNPGGSGLSQMQFSNDDVNWSLPEDFVLFKDWQLAAGDGTKAVYVKYSDAAGNWSDVYSDTIIMDESAPSPPVVTDDGITTDSDSQLHCRWASSDDTSGISEYQYKITQHSASGQAIVDWASAETATEITKTSLSLSNNTIYYFSVKAKNNAGLWSDIGYSDGIKVEIIPPDTTAPVGTIKINNDAVYANSKAVTLNLSAQDEQGGSGLDKMQFSNNNNNWSTPENYASSKSWTLASGDGNKTVYVKYEDSAGNWSNSYSDTIILDESAPSAPVVTDDGPTTPSDSQLHCSWASSENTSGISEYQYKISQDSASGQTIIDWTSTGTDTEVTKTELSLTDGKTYCFSVKAENNAGLWSDIGYSDGITVELVSLDTTPPTGSITVENDASYAGSAAVILNLTAEDNPGGSGLDKMRLSNNNINWSSPENYASSKSWTLASGDGPKTVYVKYSDASGNWSQVYSDNITLDTHPPQINAVTPADASFGLEGYVVSLYVGVDDNGLSPVEYQYSIDGQIIRPWITVPFYHWNSQVGGMHTIKFEARDVSGGGSSEAEIYLVKDPIRPPN